MFWEDIATQSHLVPAFRICFENSSVSSLGHAANSFFDYKWKRYKFLEQRSISCLVIANIFLTKCSQTRLIWCYKLIKIYLMTFNRIYMLRTRDYCDRTQQHVNSNLYSLVYVRCLFNKAATLPWSWRVCDVTIGTNFYLFPLCSSVVGWYWRSIKYHLLPSQTCWYCVLDILGLWIFSLPSSLHQGFCCARMDNKLM
jgi:hypothetical protein